MKPVKDLDLVRESYSFRQIGKLLDVSYNTVRNHMLQGKIKMYRYEETGRWYATKEDVITYLKKLDMYIEEPTNNKISIGYARVSSNKQKQEGDLDRQVVTLVNEIQKETSNYMIITDVGSGLNTKRRGLNRVIRKVMHGEVDKIYLTYKDRLTRFGYEYLEILFSYFQVDVIILSKTEDRNCSDELLEDMFSLIASFSGKLYGMRSSKTKIINKTESIIDKKLK